MDSPPEFLAYFVANIGFIAIGGLLAGLSLLAYRKSGGQRSYALATIGFGFVILGGSSELAFTLVFSPDFVFTSTEFLYLQAGEDVLLAVGLGLLFYAITQHATDSPYADDFGPLIEEGDSWAPGGADDD